MNLEVISSYRSPQILSEKRAHMIRRMILLTILGLVILIAACALFYSRESKEGVPIRQEELETKLADPRLLKRFDVEEIFILETDTYKVLIGSRESDRLLGEMYYTIQDGWHLKADNEILEFVPGEGWLIAEQ